MDPDTSRQSSIQQPMPGSAIPTTGEVSASERGTRESLRQLVLTTIYYSMGDDPGPAELTLKRLGFSQEYINEVVNRYVSSEDSDT